MRRLFRDRPINHDRPGQARLARPSRSTRQSRSARFARPQRHVSPSKFQWLQEVSVGETRSGAHALPARPVRRVQLDRWRTGRRIRKDRAAFAAFAAFALVPSGTACNGGNPKVNFASAITFPAQGTRGGATNITLEGATWGDGPVPVIFAHSYPTSQ